MSLSSFPFSPLQRIETVSTAVELYIKRDDLIHPLIEGNKWRKLKYNIQAILDKNIRKVVTFGGAYSNHLLATSQAGRIYGFETRAYVNAPYADPSNPTLSACISNGMKIDLVDRTEFRRLQAINKMQDDGYILPEGGSNEAALKGCSEIYMEIISQLPDVSHIITPMGTGGTATGINMVKDPDIRLIVIPVLRLNGRIHISRLFGQQSFSEQDFWSSYHFGGYARYNDSLIHFIKQWFRDHHIVLDPVYNGKALYGLIEKIGQYYFPEGSKIVYLHTGGSQGILGFNQRHKQNLPAGEAY